MNGRFAEQGASAPLGATVTDGGVNFSVFSKHATGIELLLFDGGNAARPAKVIPLDPVRHRTYHYWHAFVPGLRPGQVYAYRVHGPFAPERGLRFDGEKVLLDPYGLAVAVPETYSRRRGPAVLAALDRHLAPLPGRHPPVEGGPFRHGADVYRPAARFGLSRSAAPCGTRTAPPDRNGGMTCPRTRRPRTCPAT